MPFWNKMHALSVDLQKWVESSQKLCSHAKYHRPVTQRSTLVVKKRLEQTAGNLETLLRASAGLVTDERSRLLRLGAFLVNSKVLRGILPRTFSRSKSTAGGVSWGAFRSTKVIFPLPLMLPKTYQSHGFRHREGFSKLYPMGYCHEMPLQDCAFDP